MVSHDDASIDAKRAEFLEMVESDPTAAQAWLDGQVNQILNAPTPDARLAIIGEALFMSERLAFAMMSAALVGLTVGQDMQEKRIAELERQVASLLPADATPHLCPSVQAVLNGPHVGAYRCDRPAGHSGEHSHHDYSGDDWLTWDGDAKP